MRILLRALGVALLASVISLMFFSPHLLVFTSEAPDSYEWARGLHFIQQITEHAEELVEPALRHRLLPVCATRLLGLEGYSTFLLGWLGVVVLLTSVYLLVHRFGLPNRAADATVFLFASSSAVITSFGWLGIFDCWWVLALVIVALAPRIWMIAAATLLSTWIDERFLIGLPVALLARGLVFSINIRAAINLGLVVLITAAPYLIWRWWSFVGSATDGSSTFLSLHFLVWLRMVPHGWWMAYRLAWIFLIACFLQPNASRIKPWQLGAVCLVAAVGVTVTAADISRSAMVFAPLLPIGVIILWQQYPKQSTGWLPWIAAANFFVPYIHVVYNKLDPVHPLPWEIIRLVKKLAV